MMLKRLKNCRGATALEFALVVPVFLLLIFVIIDFGWFFYVKHTIKLANHEGARVGRVSGNNVCLMQVIKAYASIAVDPDELDITINRDPIPSIYPKIKIREVTTQYTHNFFSPMIAAFGDKIITAKDTYKLEY